MICSFLNLGPNQHLLFDIMIIHREEPENSMAVEDDVSIGGILQFRHSLSFLDGRYMFSKCSDLQQPIVVQILVELMLTSQIVYVANRYSMGRREHPRTGSPRQPGSIPKAFTSNTRPG